MTYIYDALGRQTRILDNNSSGAYDDVEVTFSYTWETNTANRILKETQRIGTGTTFTTEQNINSEGERTYLKYPNAYQLDYAYDALRRATSITNHADSSTVIDYTYRGRYLSHKSIQNGLNTIEWGSTANLNHYDTFGRPKLFLYGGGYTWVRLNYAYDYGSDVTWRCDQSEGTWGQKYTYDNLQRLIKAEQGVVSNWNSTPFAPTMPSPQKTWTWDDQQANGPELDKLGNWVEFNNNATTDARVHNTANEIDSRTVGGAARTITHDAAGNVATCQDGDGVKTWQYTYDFRNRLITVESKTDGSYSTVATYLYDGLNRRAKKDLTSGGSVDRLYLYDGWRAIEERDANTTTTVLWQNVYGTQYIDELVCGFYPHEGGFLQLIYMQDANYNVVAIAELAEHAQFERYCYEPYGKFTIGDLDGDPASPLWGNALTFQGQRYDTESGLYYFRNRYYSPVLGRFLQRDFLGYVSDMNMYSGFRAKPIAITDEAGLCPEGFSEMTPEDRDELEKRVEGYARPLVRRIKYYDPAENYVSQGLEGTESQTCKPTGRECVKKDAGGKRQFVETVPVSGWEPSPVPQFDSGTTFFGSTLTGHGRANYRRKVEDRYKLLQYWDILTEYKCCITRTGDNAGSSSVLRYPYKHSALLKSEDEYTETRYESRFLPVDTWGGGVTRSDVTEPGRLDYRINKGPMNIPSQPSPR